MSAPITSVLPQTSSHIQRPSFVPLNNTYVSDTPPIHSPTRLTQALDELGSAILRCCSATICDDMIFDTVGFFLFLNLATTPASIAGEI